VLFRLILLVCVIGVYGVSENVWDVVIMLGFGLAGYLMRKTGYEPAPLVLAFVLGRLAEEAIRQSLLLSRGRLGILNRAADRRRLPRGDRGGHRPAPRAAGAARDAGAGGGRIAGGLTAGPGGTPGGAATTCRIVLNSQP